MNLIQKYSGAHDNQRNVFMTAYEMILIRNVPEFPIGY